MKHLVFIACALSGCANVASKALEERVVKLEQESAQNAEAMAFLREAYASQKAQRDAEAARAHAPDATFAIGIDGNATSGPADAWVTIVEAWDFACPYCLRITPTLHDLVKQYNGQVRVAYKNFVIHPETAMQAHLGGCAANLQGKFDAFLDAYWEKGFGAYMQSRDPEKVSRANILAIAKELKFDMGRFTTDMDGQACKAIIARDQADMERFGVNATPTLFVNGQFADLSSGDLKTLVDKKLADAKASGVPAADYYQKVIMTGETEFRSANQPKPKS